MTGRSGALVLQPRDHQVLRAVAQLRVIDRDDARVVGGFHSRTRVNARLLALVRAGLLVAKPAGTTRGGHKLLYALSVRGAHLLQVPYRAPLWQPHSTLAWSLGLEHQLAVNRVYLALTHIPSDVAVRLIRWRTFNGPVSPAVRLIPDAYVELETSQGVRAIFLEVDRGTETRRVWHRKVQAYLALATSGTFATQFGQPQFRVAVVTVSVRRLESLRACITRSTDKLFWLSAEATHSAREWFWTPCWLRPRGQDRHSLV